MKKVISAILGLGQRPHQEIAILFFMAYHRLEMQD